MREVTEKIFFKIKFWNQIKAAWSSSSKCLLPIDIEDSLHFNA